MLSNSIGLLGLCAGAGVTLTLCLKAKSVGERLGVMAHPDVSRKLHKCATPQVGGLAILAGMAVWILAMLLIHTPADRSLLYAIGLSAIGVGTVGFADDQRGLSPGPRILLLLVFVGAAFVLDREFMSLRLNWGSFEPTSISIWAYIPLIGLTAGGVVNSVNMADGQDGIAGGMFVIWSGCLMLSTSSSSAEIACVVLVLSLVFLSFNLRGLVFLGDCGSYGVTFVLGLLVTLAHARGQLTLETAIVWFFIPVIDCLRLLISRPLRGRSPFNGDRDHFHHRLEDKMGKRQGLACYLGAVGISSVVATLEPRLALVCLCMLSAFYFSFAWLTDANIPVGEEGKALANDNVVAISSSPSVPKRKRKGAA